MKCCVFVTAVVQCAERMEFIGYAYGQIQSKMEEGTLPRVPPLKVFVEYGTGRACDGCDEEIHRTEVMHEAVLPGGQTLAFHGACEIAWREVIAGLLALAYSGLPARSSSR